GYPRVLMLFSAPGNGTMNTLRLPTIFACTALLASGLAVGGEIYKWVDENGNVHYEDRPIAEANASVERVVDVRSRNTDEAAVAARVDERRKAQAAADQVESEAPQEMSRQRRKGNTGLHRDK
ncbi:MAG: DUF4124 domain-containing protein, partial [Nitrospirota bacterium]